MKSVSEMSVDEFSHHLLITPYLLDSKYIKEIKNIKNL